MPDNQRKIVLSVAGLDPSAGAGILADIQTMQQCKVRGMSVATALTAQNEDKVHSIQWQEFPFIAAQLHSLFEKYRFDVVKIGIVKDLQILDQLIELLIAHQSDIKIIWDPVLQSSSGFNFLENLDPELLQRVLSKVYLITPNLPEYEAIVNILEKGQIGTRILLKGGHKQGEDTSDILMLNNEEKIQIFGHRIKVEEKHGTGCVLSSAIASGLCRGMKLKTACTFGKRYVESYIKTGFNKLGTHYEIEI